MRTLSSKTQAISSIRSFEWGEIKENYAPKWFDIHPRKSIRINFYFLKQVMFICSWSCSCRAAWRVSTDSPTRPFSSPTTSLISWFVKHACTDLQIKTHACGSEIFKNCKPAHTLSCFFTMEFSESGKGIKKDRIALVKDDEWRIA